MDKVSGRNIRENTIGMTGSRDRERSLRSMDTHVRAGVNQREKARAIVESQDEHSDREISDLIYRVIGKKAITDKNDKIRERVSTKINANEYFDEKGCESGIEIPYRNSKIGKRGSINL